MAHQGQEPCAEAQEVYVRNTFLCVREASEDSEEDEPALVRHIRSEPAGYRQLPRTVRVALKDLLDECDPVIPEGESTGSEEDGQPTAASSHQGSRSSLEELMAWSTEPRVPDAAPRTAERGPAGAAEDAMARAWPASCFGPAHAAAWTAHAMAAKAAGHAMAARAAGRAMAARDAHAPDMQTGDVARGALLRASRAVPLLTSTAFPEANVLQGPASLQESRELVGKESAHLTWTVDAWKIHSMETKIASPRFCICLPTGPCPFQLVLYAQSKGPRLGGYNFKRAHGRGRVEMRCGAELPKGLGNITFRLSLGDQPPRPPVSHDFSQQLCCGLRRWDFGAAADPATGTLGVHLEIVALGPFEGPFASASLSPAPARHGGA